MTEIKDYVFDYANTREMKLRMLEMEQKKSSGGVR